MDRLAPGGKEAIFRDRDTAGFGVRVYPSGGKVYIARAKERTGEKLPGRVAIGRHDALDAGEARRRTALGGMPLTAVSPSILPDLFSVKNSSHWHLTQILIA